MWKQLDQYVRTCHSCLCCQLSRRETFGVLQQWPVPLTQLEETSMDHVVWLPECDHFKMIWVVVDTLSKMRHIIPCHTATDAVGFPSLFLRVVVHLRGLPATIVSDRGLQYASTIS